MNKLKAVSLFASAGIGELLVKDTNIDVVLANEIIPRRAECYHFFYPHSNMICGDIADDNIRADIQKSINDNDISVLIATPPCQGLSTLGKNKIQSHFEQDKRNFLILYVLDIIDNSNFDYILIENVPKFIEMYFPYNGDYLLLEDILKLKYSEQYHIKVDVLNAKDYGISQSRPRAIIRLFKKHLKWSLPNTEPEISLFEAIGHLPSLEAGKSSDIKWHNAKPHNDRAVLAMKHTKPGKSAIANEVYYPKKEDGTRIKGFHNTFKRMVWEQPCPARTTFSGSISSHNNVHPGRLLSDGTYSDARVLTLLETFIVSSIPSDIEFPKGSTDTFIRTVIGEAIPPRLMTQVLLGIGK